MKVQSGYEVDLYADVNYGGGLVKLTANNANLAGVNFNDTASSFKLVKLSTIPTSDTPDFGPNVQIFDPSMSATTIQNGARHRVQLGDAEPDRAVRQRALRLPVQAGHLRRHANAGLL